MNISEGLRVKINVVAFLVLGVGLIYLMANQVLTVLQDRYTVYGIFDDAGGVFTDQEVTYRGITVGQVGKMEVIEGGVRIGMEIDEGTEVPREGIVARVMFKSAVGEQFIDLLPGSDGPPFLKHEDVIPNDQTEIPVQTQELLTLLERVLRGVPPEDLKGAVDSLGIGLTGRGPDIATIMESLADVSETFADSAPHVEAILRRGTEVGGEFLKSRRAFARAIEELVTVSQTLADSRDDLRGLMEGGNLTSDELVSLVRQNRAALHSFLRRFAEVNELQAEHAGDLSQLFVQLPRGLGNVNKTFEPKTGLVRFGLVNDESKPACSYKTERRSPSNRRHRLPPKNARCGGNGPNATGQRVDTTDAPTGSVLGRLDPEAASDVPQLPARMRDWSWLLLYLRPLTL